MAGYRVIPMFWHGSCTRDVGSSVARRCEAGCCPRREPPCSSSGIEARSVLGPPILAPNFARNSQRTAPGTFNERLRNFQMQHDTVRKKT